MQELFNTGVDEARAKFGAECRPVDETLFGLRAVLRAGGREYEILDLYNRWGCATCFNESLELKKLVKCLVGEVNRILQHYARNFEQDRQDRSYVIRHAWDQVRLWDFKRQVRELIDNDIRRHQPGIRRGTLVYKRLARLIFAQAQMAILRDMADRLNSQMRTLRLHLEAKNNNTVASEADRMQQSGIHLHSLALDIQLLDPEATVISPLVELADRHHNLADQLLAPVHTALDEMYQTFDTICEIQIILTRADKARQEWYHIVKRADGLKGAARREPDRLAMAAMAEAEAAELETVPLLRKENLLGEEEGMLCDF